MSHYDDRVESVRGPPPRQGTNGSYPRRRSRSPNNFDHGRKPASRYAPARITDPYSIDALVSFDFYKKWAASQNSDVGVADKLRERYNDYVVDLLGRTSKAFIEQHSVYPSFTETYVSDFGRDATLDESQDLKQLKLESYRHFASRLAADDFEKFDTSARAETYKMDEWISDPFQTHSATADSLVVSQSVLMIKSISPRIPRQALETWIKSQVPDAVKAISMSTPDSRLLRVGWIYLNEGTDAKDVLIKLDGRLMSGEGFGEYQLNLTQHKFVSSDLIKKRLLFPQLSKEERLSQDLSIATDLATSLDAKLGQASLLVEIARNSQLCESEGQQVTHDSRMRELDIVVEYLRQVHFYDFYRLQSFDSLQDLQLVSPGYVRPGPDTSGQSELEFESWSSTFAVKLSILREPQAFLQKLGVLSANAMLENTVMSVIKKEEDNKFRCQVVDEKGQCTKLFKDVPFVKKHIEKRHGEWYSKVKTTASVTEGYLVNPNRIAPYKEHHEEPVEIAPNSPPRRGRERGRGYERDRFDRGGRGGYEPRVRNYRDLDAPQEDLPELDY